ncbi:MAG TPA: dephospho-CoA kinase [Solirubrobacteraceae bacterium]|nr:dephospho-CoA kinase [Solirubrobacteraceae bacterium]
MIPFVGLTGGIGSGKSTALAALERLGCAVLSTDAVVHELYESPDVIAAVRERFGTDIAPDGPVDRSLLAERAFATPEARQWLEQLLWPRVGRRMWEWKAGAEAAQPPPRAIVVEVPLLFESGMNHGFDATIAVIADEGLRGRRAERRGHRALNERAARQLSQQEKAARSTYVVVNDGAIPELEQKLSAVLDKMTPGADERDQ